MTVGMTVVTSVWIVLMEKPGQSVSVGAGASEGAAEALGTGRTELLRVGTDEPLLATGAEELSTGAEELAKKS